MGYSGRNLFDASSGTFSEAILSRQHFPFNHATEAMTIPRYRQEMTMDISSDSNMTKGINGGEYVDLYQVTGKIPDLLVTPQRMRAWYLLAKEPSNLRVKQRMRGAPLSQYWNFVDDTADSPSRDGSTENGSTLVAINPTFKIDQTINIIEGDFSGGMSIGQYAWLCNHSTGTQPGGSGGTGSLLPALTNSTADKGAAGLYKVTIDGADLGTLTKENCSWQMKGVSPSDRNAFNEMKFLDSFEHTVVLEVMESRLNAGILQAIIDADGAGGTTPAVVISSYNATVAGGLKIEYAQNSISLRGKVGSGDNKGMFTITGSFVSYFNTDEAAPDSMDFGITAGANIVKFLAP